MEISWNSRQHQQSQRGGLVNFSKSLIDGNFLEFKTTSAASKMRPYQLFQVSNRAKFLALFDESLVDLKCTLIFLLLQEDQLILARASITCFDETPLHVACMLGHVPFAKALLAHKRDLAMELDSQGRVPLHLASANGYVELARELLQSDPLACLVHDEDGRTPLHLATMKGRINIVIELVKARPEVAEHRLSHGQTALHLGVRHNRLETLKVLVEMVGDGDLVNAQDDEGNTILHLAAWMWNIMNRNGFSTLDIVEHFPKDFKVIELRELLVHAGALRAIRFGASTTHQAVVDNTNEENSTVVVDLASIAPPSTNTPPVNIIATVIAAMAYQAGLSPPCGLWDNDQKDDNGTILYYAGTSIMAANLPEGYAAFWIYNTVSFLASLSTIFLLMSGLPLGKKVLMWILTATMWVTITFMALTYFASMTAISPITEDGRYSMDRGSTTVVTYSLFVWLGIVAIVFLVHTVRFLTIVLRNVKESQKLKKWIAGCVSWCRSTGNIKI
ncbi:hypothetical protein EUGRSUZ_C03401 [Eucalyptus grandis]|uniref:Uncharacterized protein n=1 Tax=Eucalyptus grandis TaxID=71139 RepID=A0ACC3LKB6_EUCGR|nr:hypothetical protein EUGRSUZ_C03401 [Eucalyptus grandis]